MSQLTTLVILAGGNGSRFGGPKQFTVFGHLQKTLMEYNIHNAIAAGFNHVVFITQAQQKEQLLREVIPRLPSHISISIAIQAVSEVPDTCRISPTRTRPLGTAHALWCAKEHVKGRFTVINADDYYGQQAFYQLQQWNEYAHAESINKRYAMVAYLVKNTLSDHGGVNRGLCKYDNQMHLKSIKEVENICQIQTCNEFTIQGVIVSDKETIIIPPNALVSMNCWAFDQQIFPAIEQILIDTFLAETNDNVECYLPDVLMTQLVKKQIEVNVLVSKDDWFGVTYEADSDSVNNKINQVISIHGSKFTVESKHS